MCQILPTIHCKIQNAVTFCKTTINKECLFSEKLLLGQLCLAVAKQRRKTNMAAWKHSFLRTLGGFKSCFSFKMSFDITSGLQENKQQRKKAQRKSIYDQQREEETIRNATDRGYLRRMTVEFLSDSVGIEDRDLPFVGYLNVTAQQLSSLGALQMCVSLRICILPGNYITEFDALAGCLNLWALDLHGNQVNRCYVVVEKAEMFCVSTTDRE